MDGLKKFFSFLLFVIVVLAVAPFLFRLLPKPITFEQARTALEKAGFTVLEYNVAATPQLESVEQVTLRLAPAGENAPEAAITANIYRFDNEGVIARQHEYNKPDVGAGMVENFNLSNIAAGVTMPRPPKPVAVGRNGMFLIVAIGEPKTAVNRIADVFEKI